tara:strand:+ start:91 stop:639 length:549 start_codon:yes stop_codon:yes gene_type:complete
MRKGQFISTYSGTEFWPADPRQEEIKIEDIAHALSLLCRGNGHVKHFYSVAQHSLYCALEARKRKLSPQVQLACLLHDGSEAYISDITRPVKRLLPLYREMEAGLQHAIEKKYGLSDITEEEKKQVKEIDDAILRYELAELLDTHDYNGLELVGDYDFSFRMMADVEKEFLDLFHELSESIA